MRRARAILLVAAVALCAPAAHAVGSNTVQVRNNYYDPQTIHIATGDTVTWTVVDGGHTVTADDGRAGFDQEALMQAGDTFQWTFDDDETFYYHCKIHRGSMFGVVVVGAGSPPPPPGDEPAEIRAVPSQYASIEAALTGAPARTRIDLAPGIYREAVQLQIPGVVLHGTGATPDDVIIDGGSARGIGVALGAPEVGVNNMTIRRHTFAGIFTAGIDGFTIDGVRLPDNAAFGVRTEGASGGLIRDSVASGSSSAGFSVTGCVACDTVVEASDAHDNLFGFLGVNAGGLVVRGSTFIGNGTGVALRSTFVTGQAVDETAPQRGSHVYGNTIADNTSTKYLAPLDTDFDIASGAGVWINGGWFAQVEDNTISGQVYGVAVTGLLAPTLAGRVVGNAISGSSGADLAWDGIGAAVCFEGNGEAPTSAPPEAQTLYACSLPVTVGVPFPTVDLTILQRAV